MTNVFAGPLAELLREGPRLEEPITITINNNSSIIIDYYYHYQ